MNDPLAPSSESSPPIPDGSIEPDALSQFGITVLRRSVERALVGDEFIEFECLVSSSLPDKDEIEDLAARGWHYAGPALYRLHPPTINGRPQILFHYGPRYEFKTDSSTISDINEPLPDEFYTDLLIHEDLVEEIVILLANLTVDECHRRTLAPIEVIEVIAETLPAYQCDAIWRDDARPTRYVFSTLERESKDGESEKVLHVAAIDLSTDRCWTHAILDWSDGRAEMLLKLHNSLLAVLPHEDILLTVRGSEDCDYGVVHHVVELLRFSLPDQEIDADIDWLSEGSSGGASIYGPAVDRLVDGVHVAWGKLRLSASELEQRILAHQGYRAAAGS